MVKAINFTKMQGLGNDYVYINCFAEKISNPKELAQKISDRHFGVGSDGLVLLLPSSVADLRMRMFNADGSEAEMCGNAIRCVAKYAREHALVTKDTVLIETLAGVKSVQLLSQNGTIYAATVDMGEATFEPARTIEIDGKMWTGTAVSMGNPHFVTFVSDPAALDLPHLGPLFEHHPLFPQRTNTEFVKVLASDRVQMRVWERGAGETLACGTGACAVAVACKLNGLTGNEVDVELQGGTLHIKLATNSMHVFMTGEATTVFDGVYYVNEEG